MTRVISGSDPPAGRPLIPGVVRPVSPRRLGVMRVGTVSSRNNNAVHGHGYKPRRGAGLKDPGAGRRVQGETRVLFSCY